MPITNHSNNNSQPQQSQPAQQPHVPSSSTLFYAILIRVIRGRIDDPIWAGKFFASYIATIAASLDSAVNQANNSRQLQQSQSTQQPLDPHVPSPEASIHTILTSISPEIRDNPIWTGKFFASYTATLQNFEQHNSYNINPSMTAISSTLNFLLG